MRESVRWVKKGSLKYRDEYIMKLLFTLLIAQSLMVIVEWHYDTPGIINCVSDCELGSSCMRGLHCLRVAAVAFRKSMQDNSFLVGFLSEKNCVFFCHAVLKIMHWVGQEQQRDIHVRAWHSTGLGAHLLAAVPALALMVVETKVTLIPAGLEWQTDSQVREKVCKLFKACESLPLFLSALIGAAAGSAYRFKKKNDSSGETERPTAFP